MACDDEDGVDKAHLRQKFGTRLTCLLLYATCFVEGADAQLLPSSFMALQSSIGLTPSHLAVMSLCQALFQSVTAPVWGIFLDHGCSAKLFLVVGSGLWGLVTLALACTTNFWVMLFLRMLNGVALATLAPVSQTVIADLTTPLERGRYFSWVGFSTSVGSMLCAFLTTGIANTTVVGIEGWRVAFAVVALSSLMLCAILALQMMDHRKPWSETSVWIELRAFIGFFRIGSFTAIVVQGCFGSIPWSAMAFVTMYFQYLGVDDSVAGLIMAASILSMAVGGVVGGQVSDRLASWSRFHGRALTAQISVASGILLVVLLFQLSITMPHNIGGIVIVVVIFGLTASWCGGSVNRPIMTEVVPARGHGRVISWLVALEGSCAACLGAPLVGLLAQHIFKYETHSGPLDSMPQEVKDRNVYALRCAMMWMTVLPWTVCFLAYTIVHLTFRRDVLQQEAALAEVIPLKEARIHAGSDSRKEAI